MTLTTPYQASFYVGDGVTKAFPFVFEEVSDNFVKVIVSHIDGTTSIPTYTVDLDLKQVVFGDETPAPTADDVVCIYRETPTIQDTPFKTLEGYNAKALENILSKIVAMIQEIKSNYFSTQVLQGDPWQLDLLKSADDGATVNIDYVAKKLVKGLYFQISNGNLQVSADGSSYITMPKSADIVEFRQVQTVLEDLTVQYRLQYRIGNDWYNAESNAEATADEALRVAEEARDTASDAKDIAQDASDKVDGFDDRLVQAEQDASDAKDIAQDASDAVSVHITDTNNPHSVTASQVGLGNVDNTSDADKPISDATQSALDGLQDEIDDLKGLGRFLSVWNCATGLAETNPPTSPYTYNSGDYFLVGTVDSTTNYKPDGSSYTTGVASTTVETDTVKVNDVYIYDGTTWKLQANVQRDVVFSAIQGDPYDNTALSNALGDKVDETSTANQVYGTDNNGDQTTYNITDFGAVDDVQVDGVSVVTSKVANINLSNYVTLSTTQAITGTKTFKAEILSWNNITFESAQANPIIRGMSGASYRNMITRTNSASAIDVGNTSDTINLKGSGTRPTYNSNDLAMYSDVPSLTGYIQNTATGTDSLTVLGTATSATNALNVGTGAGASGNNAVAYGNYASAEGEGSVAIGSDSSTTYRARATHKGNIAIGHDAYAINDTGIIAIGETAHAQGKNTIQLGTGTNNTQNTFQVRSYTLLDTSTGLIPDARISTNITRTTDLATVATSGDYDDLINKPTIPAAQVNSDWNANSGVAQILNKPTLGTAAVADTTDFATATQGGKADTAVQPGDLATVATSGSYTDLNNKPTIPTTLAGLTGDVSISSPTDGQSLIYDGNTSKWKNVSSSVSVGFSAITGSPYDNTNLANELNNIDCGTMS